MKFDDLDKKMRVFETAHDFCVLPNIYMVARLDGRNFTRLTKEDFDFERPFDVKFRDFMVETTKHLMESGFRVIYGFTESDEISLLFHLEESIFGRKTRKFNSVLAGEASAKFSLLAGSIGCFDCRISQLPTQSDVVDYFRWRNEDAHRNALNAHCYWTLRKEGSSAKKATASIEGISNSTKNEMLFQRGINFNELPKWQKRGIGLFWEKYEKTGWNPKLKQEEHSLKQRIKVDLELPMKDEYNSFIKDILESK